MTGTNRTLDAARNGPEKQRQLLRKEMLAAENLFSLLTAHANGRPLFTTTIDPFTVFPWASFHLPVQA
jgi:hypothetical protein